MLHATGKKRQKNTQCEEVGDKKAVLRMASQEILWVNPERIIENGSQVIHVQEIVHTNLLGSLFVSLIFTGMFPHAPGYTDRFSVNSSHDYGFLHGTA